MTPDDWGDLQPVQPPARPRPEPESEDNPFIGTVIDMREVRRANIRDGVIRYYERKREKELEPVRRLTEYD